MSGPIKLRCLGGREPPPELSSDLARVLALPPEALARFWHVLGPSLGEPVAREAEQLLDEYCRAFRLPERELAHAVKACRFLLREAAQRDLSRDDFVADVTALHPDAPLLLELLPAGYERARAQVRGEILRSAVSGHGKLVVDVDWRVDTMEASKHGARIRAPVALLTLSYREGGDAQRITLQLLPDMLVELKTACERMLA